MISKLINIASWIIEKYENIKGFIKTKYRAHRSRKIRRLIDDGNVDTVADIVRDIKKRRRSRRDAS